MRLARRRRRRQRQPHLKPRIPWLGTNLNVAAMFSYNSLHRIESEASSLAHAFSSKERFKNMGLNLRRNSGPIVGNLHHHAIVLAIRPHAQLALTAHRVNRVVDEV